MYKKGFSLIEILVGISLFAVLMVSTIGVMISTLRVSRKANAVALAKSEGAYALKTMEAQIRYAEHIDCAGDTMNVYKLKNGGQITYSFGSNKISTGVADLTSGAVTVSKGSPQLCANVFTCSATNGSVTICFVIDKTNGQDVSDKAGINGILFQSMVTLVNTSQ